jgi:hypothetical protein
MRGASRSRRPLIAGHVILFARSQTEQPATAAGARQKVEAIAASSGRDGMPVLIREDAAGESYVVHREGAQPGAVVTIGR